VAAKFAARQPSRLANTVPAPIGGYGQMAKTIAINSHHGVYTGNETGAHGEQPVPTPDIIFENHGSLFLLRPVSKVGQTWLDENVGDENTLTFGGAVVCEPRYVEAIVLGAQADGLEVRA
jgi:hypothetical protein